jgi:hypothetical protein
MVALSRLNTKIFLLSFKTVFRVAFRYILQVSWVTFKAYNSYSDLSTVSAISKVWTCASTSLALTPSLIIVKQYGQLLPMVVGLRSSACNPDNLNDIEDTILPLVK